MEENADLPLGKLVHCAVLSAERCISSVIVSDNNSPFRGRPAMQQGLMKAAIVLARLLAAVRWLRRADIPERSLSRSAYNDTLQEIQSKVKVAMRTALADNRGLKSGSKSAAQTMKTNALARILPFGVPGRVGEIRVFRGGVTLGAPGEYEVTMRATREGGLRVARFSVTCEKGAMLSAVSAKNVSRALRKCEADDATFLSGVDRVLHGMHLALKFLTVVDRMVGMSKEFGVRVLSTQSLYCVELDYEMAFASQTRFLVRLMCDRIIVTSKRAMRIPSGFGNGFTKMPFCSDLKNVQPRLVAFEITDFGCNAIAKVLGIARDAVFYLGWSELRGALVSGTGTQMKWPFSLEMNVDWKTISMGRITVIDRNMLLMDVACDEGKIRVYTERVECIGSRFETVTDIVDASMASVMIRELSKTTYLCNIDGIELTRHRTWMYSFSVGAASVKLCVIGKFCRVFDRGDLTIDWGQCAECLSEAKRNVFLDTIHANDSGRTTRGWRSMNKLVLDGQKNSVRITAEPSRWVAHFIDNGQLGRRLLQSKIYGRYRANAAKFVMNLITVFEMYHGCERGLSERCPAERTAIKGVVYNGVNETLVMLTNPTNSSMFVGTVYPLRNIGRLHDTDYFECPMVYKPSYMARFTNGIPVMSFFGDLQQLRVYVPELMVFIAVHALSILQFVAVFGGSNTDWTYSPFPTRNRIASQLVYKGEYTMEVRMKYDGGFCFREPSVGQSVTMGSCLANVTRLGTRQMQVPGTEVRADCLEYLKDMAVGFCCMVSVLFENGFTVSERTHDVTVLVFAKNIGAHNIRAKVEGNIVRFTLTSDTKGNANRFLEELDDGASDRDTHVRAMLYMFSTLLESYSDSLVMALSVLCRFKRSFRFDARMLEETMNTIEVRDAIPTMRFRYSGRLHTISFSVGRPRTKMIIQRDDGDPVTVSDTNDLMTRILHRNFGADAQA